MKSQTALPLLVTSLFLNFNPSHGLRILGLFPFHSKSHYVMCEVLMRGLAEKGHQVDVYSHFPSNKPIPNFKDFHLNGTLPMRTNNVSYEFASISYGPKILQLYLQNFGKKVCDLMGLAIFQDLMDNPPNDPSYDIVVTELSIANCYIPWGRHLNVPIVGIVTLPLIDYQYEPLGVPINLAVDPSLSTSYRAPMSFFQRLENWALHYTLRHTFVKYSYDQDEAVEKYFGPGLPRQVDLMKDLSLLLLNHNMAIGGIKALPPLVVPVGGLHIVDHNETLPNIVQKWLDESKDGCVYFSFGSLTRLETFPVSILLDLYKSFENIAPVRVLLKIAKPEELPPGLPSNVLTQPWLSQIQVLKHPSVRAFVTHGGLMGTQESIYYGVPMIGIPLFVDQHLNVASYVERKIAVKVDLDELTEKSFTDAVNEILTNPTYRNTMREVSLQFKDRPMSALDTSVFWVEYISRHGKDALKSQFVDMPWWQASLLDICGFIALATFSAVYIAIVILRKFAEFVWWDELSVGYFLKKHKTK